MWFCSAVSLLIGIGQLSIRGALLGLDEYDDGVYFGSAVRLAQGHLPYRSFVFPHPPGITLLLFPLGLIGRLSSTRVTFGVVRILSMLVAAGAVFLIGRILRHRGVAAVLAGGLSLAVYPLAAAATKSVLLEPYVVLVLLVALTLFLDDGEIVDGRRLLWAGVVFGFAAAVKLWAALPILALIVCCAIVMRAEWARWRRLALGVFAGFVVPCAPFFFAAPRRFVRQVVELQLQRGASSGGLPVRDRIILVTGSRALPDMRGAAGWSTWLLVLTLLAIVAALVVRPRPQALDWFAVPAALISVVVVLKLSDYFTHYGYFTAAFLALAGGAAVGRLLGAGNLLIARLGRAPQMLVVVVVAAVLLAGLNGALRGRAILDRWPGLVTTGDVGPDIARLVPAGACTITDDPSLLLTANRFVGGGDCPAVVDSFYAWLDADPKHPPPNFGTPPRQLVDSWKRWMEQADYVVLSVHTDRLPWNSELSAWFNERFELAGNVGPAVYRRR